MSQDPVPRRFPIFPLPNVVLFPEVLQPLHIFEPRYRRMTEDALEGDRVIGMVLLREEAEPSTPPAVFPVGCTGRIVRSERLDDGRFLILLQGEQRFRLESEEKSDLPYRVANARLLDDSDPDSLSTDERTVLDEERRRIEKLFLSIMEKTLPDSTDEVQARLERLGVTTVIHTVAASLDLPPLEKQSILERDDLADRGRVLRLLLEFKLAELASSGSAGRSN